MSGKKGRSGRKRTARNIVKYFNDQIDLHSTELVDVTIQKALGGDREMIIYCWDRRAGKPTVKTDLKMEGVEMLGTGAVVKLFQLMSERKRELEQLPAGNTTSNLIPEGSEKAGKS